ncbi:unnamed protein product [Owenia fusiformis]|uniref:Uncharacterized protein n=1 Tax=Owenia fusiformis TaxID=6347 RepID=A0A8J1Y0R5_OWEFU|nr:unnamed protein product [Owenia fusiformis]
MAKAGYFRKAIQNLAKSLTPATGLKKTRFIGQDHLGNKYFEKLKDASSARKDIRWVEPASGDEWDNPEMPTEWTAWLQNRRSEPPSVEEISRNTAIMMMKQQKGKRLEAEYKRVSDEMAETGEIHRESETPEARLEQQKKYPTYEEYEISPGETKQNSSNNR